MRMETRKRQIRGSFRPSAATWCGRSLVALVDTQDGETTGMVTRSGEESVSRSRAKPYIGDSPPSQSEIMLSTSQATSKPPRSVPLG